MRQLILQSVTLSKYQNGRGFFYAKLCESGIITLPQYRIDQYALDLAIVNGNKKLNIEVDGEMYHRNWTGELCRRTKRAIKD